MNIIRAPDFPKDAPWINTPYPLSFHTNLKGHVVLLDFWTYCCINCMHVLPELAALEARFKNDPLIVIGVHSAKFSNEQSPDAIRAAIHRYHIEHPVVVDADRRIWDQYAIRAWPTLVLVGADGRIVGAVSGEGHRPLLENAIAKALADARAAGTLTTSPLALAPDPALPPTALRFPGKLLADPARNRLLIVDSNHHRIVITSLPDPAGNLQLLETIGTGQPGRADGPFAQASFHRPQGAALAGNILYIADTESHLVRRADLDKKTVTTLLGTGQQKFEPEAGKSGKEQVLNSPWDLALHANRLYISQAGQHQLWAMNLMSAMAEVAAGTGREALYDGPAAEAALAQPSGLALDPVAQRLYFADAETSSIRYLDLTAKTVHTLVGKGLFVFGDVDGPADAARLQHPLGLALSTDRQTLFIADTYNHKIKSLHLPTLTVQTLAGGPGLLNEPASLTLLHNTLLIADTNHHRLVELDLATQSLRELTLTGVPLASPT
jgi:sugar lactone lactonase YvrE